MTKQEFESRVKMEVSINEYKAIEEVYMNSDLDKDEFCKVWVKMNASRVEAAKAKAKAAAKKEALLDKLFEIAGLSITLDTSVLYSKLAPEFISYDDSKMLEGIGIDIRHEPGAFGMRMFKTIGDVCYDIQKYIKTAVQPC